MKVAGAAVMVDSIPVRWFTFRAKRQANPSPRTGERGETSLLERFGQFAMSDLLDRVQLGRLQTEVLRLEHRPPGGISVVSRLLNPRQVEIARRRRRVLQRVLGVGTRFRVLSQSQVNDRARVKQLAA